MDQAVVVSSGSEHFPSVSAELARPVTEDYLIRLSV